MSAWVAPYRWHGVLLTLAVLALLGACGPQAASQGSSTAGGRVTIANSYRFEPSVLQVTPGTAVIWVNDDSYTHSIRFTRGIDFQSQPLRPGESTTYTFAVPGEYEYVCGIHPQTMKGKVVVQSPYPSGY